MTDGPRPDKEPWLYTRQVGRRCVQEAREHLRSVLASETGPDDETAPQGAQEGE